jgi:AAA15 family ATPase/GTPase
MKILSVRIQNLRCVEDSDEFTIEGLTCLVGKNESGKTTILKGLYKLNPENLNDSNFVPLEDYPRRRYSSYKSRHEKDPDMILTTKWELDDSDVAEIAKKVGEKTLSEKIITITKGYDNRIRVSDKIDEQELVNHLISTAKLNPDEIARVSNSKTILELRNKLTGAPPLTPPQNQLLSTLQSLSPDGLASTAVGSAISSIMPKFLYFADYEKMSGQVGLDDFLTKKNNKQLKEGLRIFSALLDLAGTSAEELKNVGKFEALKAELEAVSNSITQQIFPYWTQNQFLKVDFDLRAALPLDPPPFNTGMVFRTRVFNDLHQVSVNFDERSTGFIWFFSFLAWFSQLDKIYGKNLIILLDEPGLSLHGRAQENLLKFIKEKLCPNHQVIYTTHSPFMVDVENLSGIRTVQDLSTKEKVIGTKVSSEVLKSDNDTIFPLQAALGYEIAQTLFVGKNTLLVEGPSDLIYLKWASNELKMKKMTQLDERWVIAPTGGIDKFWSFVALFGGNKLNLAVVSDYHHGDKTRLYNLRKSSIIPSERVITVDKYVNQPEADIEDMLGSEFYTSLVGECYGIKDQLLPCQKALNNTSKRITEQVEFCFVELKKSLSDLPPYDHYKPAAFLIEHADLARKLPGYDDALIRFKSLNEDLNSFLY